MRFEHARERASVTFDAKPRTNCFHCIGIGVGFRDLCQNLHPDCSFIFYDAADEQSRLDLEGNRENNTTKVVPVLFCDTNSLIDSVFPYQLERMGRHIGSNLQRKRTARDRSKRQTTIKMMPIKTI